MRIGEGRRKGGNVYIGSEGRREKGEGRREKGGGEGRGEQTNRVNVEEVSVVSPWTTNLLEDFP